MPFPFKHHFCHPVRFFSSIEFSDTKLKYGYNKTYYDE